MANAQDHTGEAHSAPLKEPQLVLEEPLCSWEGIARKTTGNDRRNWEGGRRKEEESKKLIETGRMRSAVVGNLRNAKRESANGNLRNRLRKALSLVGRIQRVSQIT